MSHSLIYSFIYTYSFIYPLFTHQFSLLYSVQSFIHLTIHACKYPFSHTIFPLTSSFIKTLILTWYTVYILSTVSYPNIAVKWSSHGQLVVLSHSQPIPINFGLFNEQRWIISFPPVRQQTYFQPRYTWQRGEVYQIFSTVLKPQYLREVLFFIHFSWKKE